MLIELCSSAEALTHSLLIDLNNNHLEISYSVSQGSEDIKTNIYLSNSHASQTLRQFFFHFLEVKL